jgi:hypothetical protein
MSRINTLKALGEVMGNLNATTGNLYALTAKVSTVTDAGLQAELKRLIKEIGVPFNAAGEQLQKVTTSMAAEEMGWSYEETAELVRVLHATQE